jgi:hypothetical protein
MSAGEFKVGRYRRLVPDRMKLRSFPSTVLYRRVARSIPPSFSPCSLLPACLLISPSPPRLLKAATQKDLPGIWPGATPSPASREMTGMA